MKIKLTLAALFLTFIAQAQWHYGIKADMNYSTISGNGMSSKWVSGVQIGGFAEWALNKQWSFQPEVLFTQSNVNSAGDFSKYYVDISRDNADKKVKLSNISVPLLVRYNLNKTLSIMAGPQAGFLLFEDDNLLKYDRASFKKFEFSATAGVQANLGAVGMYLRYVRGLSNINDIDDRYKWYSNHLQVGIAVRIK